LVPIRVGTSREVFSHSRGVPSAGFRKAGAKSAINLSAIENPSAGSSAKGTSDTDSLVIGTPSVKVPSFVCNTGKNGETNPRSEKLALESPIPQLNGSNSSHKFRPFSQSNLLLIQYSLSLFLVNVVKKRFTMP